ncbi:MAG: hypothetical protein DRP96_07810 [Candidatus Neomarinimicrobiota bacterium]|nr:MAG: hypothetical protein DRP96_07810 [Candidatus Neomarinimicrobiota bacterium]
MKIRNVTIFSLCVMLLIIVLLPVSASAQWGKALHYKWWEHDRLLVLQSVDYWPEHVYQGTIECFFKLDSTLRSDNHGNTYTYIISKNQAGAAKGDFGIAWKTGEGRLHSWLQNATSTAAVYTNEIQVWQPRWYHMAVTWDVDDSMRIWIDGVQMADRKPSGVDGYPPLDLESGNMPIVIGNQTTEQMSTTWDGFRGVIDEFRISNVVRYTEDFEVPTEPFEADANTMALWHFDEGEGLVAHDAAFGLFDGALGNAVNSYVDAPQWVDIEYSEKIIINEVLLDERDNDVNGDGVSDIKDEFVELTNISNKAVDLSGWQLGDDDAITFTFPDGYALGPNQFVTVVGGGDVSGLPGYDADPLKTAVFSAGGSIGDGLTETGEYIILLSRIGYSDCYLAVGDKADAGAPTSAIVDGVDWEFVNTTAAAADQKASITRSQDANTEAEDPFVVHSEVSSAKFSPGTTIDGADYLSYVVTMSMNPEGVGTLEVDTVMARYEYNQVVTFTAMPIYGEGHAFGYWTTSDEGFSSKLNPLTMSINKPQNVVAHFVPRIQITPRVVINEVNFDVYKDANGDGIIESNQDEFVEIINISPEDVDLTGWRLGDDEELSFTFPDGYVIKSGQIVTVFSGGNITNVPGFNVNPLKSRVFVSDVIDRLGNGLNNTNEAILLISADGSEDMYIQNRGRLYKGDPFIKSAEGIDFEIRFDVRDSTWNNNSITLYPDGDLSEDDPYVQHKNVALNDSCFSPGQTVDFQDYIVVNAIDDGESGLPRSFALHQNFPNPFNPETTIRFDVPNHARVRLVIYDILGKKVAELADKEFNAGYYQLRWNGRDRNGRTVPAGVYFYRIQTDNFTQTNKMILLK